MLFQKPPINHKQQLEKLKSRGLVISDESFALHCLEHHNYYRLSAYRFPLAVQGNPDQFLPKTTFEDLWGLYNFDRQLRLLVVEAVKRLEISVRSRWAYILALSAGPLAYEYFANFSNQPRHTSDMEILDKELSRSKEDFVKHYSQKYKMPRPPIWAVCEIMSFGLLSRFYENIKLDKIRKDIAATYDLSPIVLKSLLEHSVYIRNLCAHHARLWNRLLTITVTLPKHKPQDIVKSLNSAEDRKIYNTLVLLAHILNIVEPANHWTNRVRALIHSQRFLVVQHMGFPSDWESRPIWDYQLSLREV